ncbi:16S rRNA (guanine(966)-N(2))-methyltransferase RsmD [Thermohalobacter berrensis]|uniref:16S rRNA (Guanine(966)-N(2))-methyltransferase RsmD n=1 Tax=Thermohalobacter berrensis TaxID=99594 RepID=A0A419TA64_9FIRM|nr:16S rRNA (guanine(966)-N(2))-methyltransferase RsmD [Thermohalobacter berrensis]RKD34374.1 16S rRNA (guanine(966)-N(2))-methyltransferase RsmD [Thermohalobacter berrensis]
MRVITGTAKGHKLKAPKGLETRPTTDRIKESLFNILGKIPGNSIVLDLFSGTGNIGIEFLSRGADECYFIDYSSECIKIIKENLSNTKLLNKSYVYKNKVGRAIEILGKKNVKFDFIFMDPPYNKGFAEPTLNKIAEHKIIKHNGIVIVEHRTNTILPEKVHNLIKVHSREYGNTTISFYKAEEEV